MKTKVYVCANNADLLTHSILVRMNLLIIKMNKWLKRLFKMSNYNGPRVIILLKKCSIIGKRGRIIMLTE